MEKLSDPEHRPSQIYQDVQSEDTLKESDRESKEKETEANKQDESITEKVAEVVENICLYSSSFN